jgi:hypothetical protein
VSLNQAVTERWGRGRGSHALLECIQSHCEVCGQQVADLETHMHVLKQQKQHQCCCKIRGKKMQRMLGVKLSIAPAPPPPPPKRNIFYCKVHALLLGSFNTKLYYFQKFLKFLPPKNNNIYNYNNKIFKLQVFVKEIKESIENILKFILFWNPKLFIYLFI